MTPRVLDGRWQVNVRSTPLLTRAFAVQFAGLAVDGTALRPGGAPGKLPGAAASIDEFATGRVIWMTSGQIHGDMPGEVAYAASKAAQELLACGIILNTVDPGLVNTGSLDPETTDRPLDDLLATIRDALFGRFGRPSDPARLIVWLAADEGRWIVGQVLSTDGGVAL